MRLISRIAAGCAIFAASILPALAQGDAKAIYDDKCATCHGADGTAKTAMGRKLKVKDVHEAVRKLKPEEMMKIVENGKSPDMDGYGKELSKDQIKAVVDYYRSLAK
jgi:mono/diheme cytochrome c family protein